MSTAAPTSGTRPERVHSGHSPWRTSIIAGLGASAVVAIVLLAFLWPTATMTVKDIDVDVVASQQSFDAFTEQAESAASSRGSDLPFVFHRVDAREDAVTAIREREVYGAIVLPAEQGAHMELLTARAASPAVATMLTQSVQSMSTAAVQGQLAAAQKNPGAAAIPAQQVTAMIAGPTITDVVPLSDDDPQGSGLAVAALPLTIGGIVGGAILANVLKGSWRRLVGVVVYAVVGGIVMVLLLDNAFGFAPAPTLELWGAVTLSLAATVSVIVGLHSVLGMPGLAIGAVLTMLIGNPISSAQAPMEFLAWHWGEIGQFFVPGATGTLVRDLSYFPDAPMAQHWLVLAGWVALGLILVVVGHHRTGGHTLTASTGGDAEAEEVTAASGAAPAQ